MSTAPAAQGVVMPVATNGANADAALNTFAQALRKAEGSGEELEKQIELFRKVLAAREKFLHTMVTFPGRPAKAVLNPMLVGWFEPDKEGPNFYKTMLLDPQQRARVAQMIGKLMSEETTWWAYCGMPCEPRRATPEEALIYQQAMQDTEAFCAKETALDRKMRELFGIYCSLPEVPGAVHFDEFAPPDVVFPSEAAAAGAGQKGVKPTLSPLGTSKLDIPVADWWPWWLGGSALPAHPLEALDSTSGSDETKKPKVAEAPLAEEKEKEKEVKPLDAATAAYMQKQQRRRSEARMQFETFPAECTRLRKVAISELQRDALLLTCAASRLMPEVKDVIKGGAHEFFYIENAILMHANF